MKRERQSGKGGESNIKIEILWNFNEQRMSPSLIPKVKAYEMALEMIAGLIVKYCVEMC